MDLGDGAAVPARVADPPGARQVGGDRSDLHRSRAVLGSPPGRKRGLREVSREGILSFRFDKSRGKVF